LYWAALFLGTHLPSQGIPGVSDKSLHFLAYAGLGFLLAWAVASFRPTWRLLVLVLVTTAAYGAFDEITQMLVPSRQADLWDWGADVLGGIAGIACYLLCLALVTAFFPRLVHQTAQTGDAA
jgi:VanZ family protein